MLQSRINSSLKFRDSGTVPLKSRILRSLVCLVSYEYILILILIKGSQSVTINPTLNADNFFHFLFTLGFWFFVQVTGYLWIFDYGRATLGLRNLRIIHGLELYQNQWAIHVSNCATLRSISATSLAEVSRGAVRFDAPSLPDLCFVDTVPWDDVLNTEAQLVASILLNSTRRDTCEFFKIAIIVFYYLHMEFGLTKPSYQSATSQNDEHISLHKAIRNYLDESFILLFHYFRLFGPTFADD